MGVVEQVVVSYLAGAAVLVGLVGLFGSANYGWSSAARWLMWWGVSFALGAISSSLWGVVTLPSALVMGWAAQRGGWSRYATLLAYLLALAALLTSLLLPQG